MRPPPPDDIRLWRRAMHDVAPLPGRPPRHHEPDRDPPRRIVQEAGETAAVQIRPAPPRSAPQPAPPLDHFAGIDRANAERLKRGRRAIEARLDLHGLTQIEAHQALARFIAFSRFTGRRCVLVITGHGRFSGGVLKEAVPRWLHEAEMRRHVLAIAPAQPQHGGTGALYVLLRRLPSQTGSN
jgi:DNA-nicking Smr family endonuclease